MSKNVLVWEITPDPSGVFDYLIVDDEKQAGEAAAHAALLGWDDGEGESEPGPTVMIRCYQMSRKEFEALPKP